MAAAVRAVPLASLERLPAVHAATVVVPLAGLAEVALGLLQRGVHVLVEKPLALHSGEARRLVAQAEAADRLLKVGYLERFNPALAGWAGGRWLVARRAGRRAAGPLALDWLVHDLDLARFLVGPRLAVEDARQGPGWVGVRLRGPDGDARLVAAEERPGVWRRLRGAGGSLDLAAGGDPLGAELAAFCAAVRGGSPGALADGRDAVDVLTLVEAVAQRLGRRAA
ncbi:MAG: Gfo/Idh/MocA family oxidoreductase [bacterium]